MSSTAGDLFKSPTVNGTKSLTKQRLSGLCQKALIVFWLDFYYRLTRSKLCANVSSVKPNPFLQLNLINIFTLLKDKEENTHLSQIFDTNFPNNLS